MSSSTGESSSAQGLGHQLISQREKQIADNVTIFYKSNGGLVTEVGEGCYMLGNDGSRYLDTCNNVACVGHSHPSVVKAGQMALAKIQTNQRFLHPQQQRYIAKLLSTFPDELNSIYMVSSGSEANDLALRLAQEYGRRQLTASEGELPAKPDDVIVIDGAYHGNGCATTDISPHKWKQSTLTGAAREKRYHKPHVHVVSVPRTYRPSKPGIIGSTADLLTHEVDVQNAAVYAAEIEEVVRSTGGCGCFVHESAMGSAGQIFYPTTYLQRVYEHVRRKGGLCIADEVS